MRPGLRQILFPGFSLDSFMSRQSDGLYYDFTKTDRHFQENVGPTPADDVGESIGLALDQRQWSGQTLAQVVAGQSELLVPGSWSMSIAGGTATATESPSGTLNITGDGTNSGRGDQSFTTVSGKIYALKFTVAGASATISVGTAQGGNTLLNVAVANGNTSTYYFIATSTTTWVRFSRPLTTTSVVSAISCKLVPGIPGIQATGTLKPILQTTGAKFDGTNDNLLTSYLAGSGANFIVALVTVPAAIAAVQAIFGAADSVRFRLVFNTNGIVGGAVGTQNEATITGGSDRRGSEVVVGISFNGSTVRLFDDASIGYENSQSGSPTTSVACRVGCYNNSGTALNPFSGSIKRLVAGREFLTLSRYLQIRNALLTA